MKTSTILLALALASLTANAQITQWSDTAGDSAWSTSSNWSAGVPNSLSNVEIAMQPTADLIGIDTGGPVTVHSFVFDAALTAPVEILPGTGAETLKVTAGITNQDNNTHRFSLNVIAGGNATYDAGVGGLTFDRLDINTRTISTSGAITIGTSIVFDLGSTAVFGSIGSVSVSGATIHIAGNYNGNAGDSFDLTTGDFSGANIGQLPAITGGLTWDTSQFFSQGILNVVPEPSVEALCGLGFALILYHWRRRQAVK